MTLPGQGPGDPETWGSPTGHPHDPRTDEGDADALDSRLRDAAHEIERLAAAVRTAVSLGYIDEAIKIMADINAMSDFTEDV